MAAWALALLLAAPGLRADLAADLARSGIERSGLSMVVGRAGEAPFFAVSPGVPRIPASNQKLLTAAAAIWTLGSNFRFVTRIALGPKGELVVIGEGDPNLSGRWFDGDPVAVLLGMARRVAAAGVREVKGGLVCDASRFDKVYVHPDWPQNQLDRWYCAPVAALVYNDSCWEVTVRPGERAGAPAVVFVQPSLLHPPIENRCVTVADRGRHLVHIGRAANGGLVVTGRILRGSGGITGTVAVRDPVRFFGEAFLAALRAEGITVSGGVGAGRVAGTRPVVGIGSDLARTLKAMLQNSQNLFAECVFKRLGDGSFPSAGKTVLRTLAAHDVPTAGLVVRDGSGLSHADRVTADALYAVLQGMRKEPVFRDALATGGRGTLRRRYKDLGRRVRAKTGTLRGVRALSGYVTGRKGGHYLFVILANGASVGRSRRLMDLVVARLARAP